MSEFTKEELEELSYCVAYAYSCRHELAEKLEHMIDNYRDPNCIHQIDRELKKCKLCGVSSRSIPCVGGWL